MANANEQELHTVLEICGIPEDERDAIISWEGFGSIEDLAVLEEDRDVTEMAARMARRGEDEGRVLLGTLQIKRLQALAFWVRDRRKRGLGVAAADFTAPTMNDAMTMKSVRKEAKEGYTDPSVRDLGTFDPDFYETYEDAFLNLLAQTRGAQGEPLRYVVRPDQVPADADFESEQQRRMFQLPLQGEAYRLDNQKVYQKLKAFLVDTSGYAWIEEFDAAEDGRAAYKAWSAHYDGEGKLSKCTKLAQAKIKELFYKNEMSMSFERYTEILKRCFRTLKKDPDMQLSPRQEVDALLEGIQTDKSELQGAKSLIRNSYARDFPGACAFFAQEVASVYGAAQLEARRTKNRKKRNISSVQSDDQGGRGRGRHGGRGQGRGRNSGRGGGRGRGRGRGQGGGNQSSINGIDVTDIFRNFSSDEWHNLGPDGRSYITNNRPARRAAGRGGGRGGGRGQGGGRHVSFVGVDDGTDEQDDNQGAHQGRQGDRGGNNGRGFGRGAYGRGGRS